MSIYYPEEDNIYYHKSKQYFEEVISCYSNGNYRSAVVLLYSVAICDMLLKLQELKDMYNDTIAKDIIDFYESHRNNTIGSRSSWEKEFINKVYDKTELLDLESLTHLNHLYDDRNFSAHPALNDNYELITPTKETVLSHIHNVLTDILIKPPILIKNIVETLTEDLKEKKDVFDGNSKDLAVYLNNRYYNKMTNVMKLRVFKAFWKFCFINYDDSDCMENININRKALIVLIDGCDKSFFEELEDEKDMLTVAEDKKCKTNLVLFLSYVANSDIIYSLINNTTKLQLDKYIENTTYLKCICWYRYDSFKDHLSFLYDEIDDIPSRPHGLVNHMVRHYKNANMYSSLLDYFIFCFANSRNFDYANWNFKHTIEPFLNDFTEQQFLELLNSINSNFQIYHRNAAVIDNATIVKYAKEKLGENFDFSQYENFEYFANDSNSEIESDGQELDDYDDLPF